MLLKNRKWKVFGHVNALLGCSASRGLRQAFSCLSKLGGMTNLIWLLFGHIKLVFLRVWWIFVNLTYLDGFLVIPRPKIVAADFRKVEKMRLNEI